VAYIHSLADSGGFQVFSLGHARKISEEGVTFRDPASGQEILLTPEKSIQIQLNLGADIIMAFDDLTGLDPKKAKVRTEEAVERTHRWLLRCIAEFKKQTVKTTKAKRPLLFGIAQGGLSKKLREKSVQFVQSTDVDGLAIGGLSVGEGTQEMHAMLGFLATLYDIGKIRYLMGVGQPNNMRFAIEHGIDMFDCVLPTRNARHGTVWISGDKRICLKNQQFALDKKPIDPKCDCYACKQGYSRALLRHLFKVGDPLAGKLASIHNLRYLQRICEEYR
jgi:queuine tRNA-ribosyltransferase